MLLVLITIATLATGTAQQMVQATGTTLFYTRHADSKCATDYYDSTKKITCKMGQNKFTLWETRFAASDAQCATPLTSKPLGMLEHDSLCQPDKKDGGFLKVHCGEDTLAATIAALPALVAPALYPSSKCASAAQLQKKTVLLGKCTPSYEQVSTGGAKVIAHMYKLTTSPGTLSFVQKKYLKGDLTCSGRVSGQKAIVYPALPAPASSSVAPTCVADPLFKGRYYLNAPSTAPYA